MNTPASTCRGPAIRGRARRAVAACLGLLWAVPAATVSADNRPAASAVARPVPSAARAPGAAASAPLPAVNLWIEWREVDEAVRDESPGGREATVIGTAALAAPQPGTWSTPRATGATDAWPATRVRLRNGGQARLDWHRPGPLVWQAEVWIGGVPGHRPGSAAEAPRPAEVGVSLRPRSGGGTRQLAVEAHWPGGSAPVAVALSIDDRPPEPSGVDPRPGGMPHGLATRLLVPLDRWTTVARSATDAGDGAAAAGTVGSRRAEPAGRLQLRVRVEAGLPEGTPVPARPAVPGR